jgi:hypothetical protein
MKDADQKRKAMSYCVANGIVPFLEVVVRNETDTDEVTSNLTDLDVVGIQIVGCDRPKRILFDCKTLLKVSPINRAFWAKGAMEYVGFQEAFVVLRKSAPDGHRLSAKNLNVHLFHEELFDHYAAASTVDYVSNPSYLCGMEAWEAWREIPKTAVRLENLFWYMNNVVALETNHLKPLRALAVQLKNVSGELDPTKPNHLAIFYSYLSALALCMTQVVGDLRNIFDPRMELPIFDRLVTRYVWEGRENYNIRNRLHKFVQTQHTVKGQEREEVIWDLKLPGWDNFLQMTRSFLEAPTRVSSCVLALKELAFRALSKSTEQGDLRIRRALNENNRTLQFCLKLISYAIASSGLPKEFAELASEELTRLKSEDTSKASE